MEEFKAQILEEKKLIKLSTLYKTESSEILLCQKMNTEEKLCIKAIESEKRDTQRNNSIQTEIKLLEKLKNVQNIVHIYGHEIIQYFTYNYYFIFMEYCSYGNLYNYISSAKEHILDDKKIYEFIYQIALGLQAIHSMGYYHRDLRPENILLRNENEIAICDFGSATIETYDSEQLKRMHYTNSINNLLMDISLKTNIIYRAPEQIYINLYHPIKEKVDIFAYGIILVMLILYYIPSSNFNFQTLLHSSKEIRNKLISGIKTLSSSVFAELLDQIFSIIPDHRFTITDIIGFLIVLENRLNQNQNIVKMEQKLKFTETFNKALNELENIDMKKQKYSMIILARRVIFGNLLTDDDIYKSPDINHINIIIDEIRTNPKNIIEFYEHLFNTNIFFYNIYSLKFAYVMHYIIFNFNNGNSNLKSPLKTLFPIDFDVLAEIDNVISFINYKISEKYFDKSETLKDIKISKYVLSYIEYIKKKINLIKNNYHLISTDNTINGLKYKEIISFNFLNQVFELFRSSYDLLMDIPEHDKIQNIIDSISSILTEEASSLCSILIIQIIVWRKMNKKFTYGVDEEFLNILEYRKINHDVIYFINEKNHENKIKYLKKLVKFTKCEENFNLKEFFEPDFKQRKLYQNIPIKIYYPDELENYSEICLSNIHPIDENYQENERIVEFLNNEASKPSSQYIIDPEDIEIVSNEIIGQGDSSRVYLGKYKGLDVALKKIKIKDINDNLYKEYQNEITALVSIRHSNIITFLGTYEENDNLVIVTEYCEGGNLFDLLHNETDIELSWDLKLKFLIEISQAMNFLHKNEPKIIHRDLKPLNILLSSEIQNNKNNNHVSIKIIDFGLSQTIYNDEEKNNNDNLLKGIGSVQWMAPEELKCLDGLNEKVDVYSFGIIIWEMITRVPPYKDMEISKVINQVCNEDKKPDYNLILKYKDNVSIILLELMENCWNKTPDSRPDFEEILETLNMIKCYHFK